MEAKRPASPTQVAERAYYIWVQAGRPDGQDLAHWLRAEAELAAEAGPPAPRTRSRKTTARKAADDAKPAARPAKKPRKKTSTSGTTRKPRTRRPRPEA